MNFEELAKEGKKFKYRDYNIDIIDTNLYTGTSYVMLGRCSNDNDLYWFFDKKTGNLVDINGIRVNLALEDTLTVVKEKKEGWFAIVYNTQTKIPPTMLGIYANKVKCEETCKTFYKEYRYEIHKMIYED